MTECSQTGHVGADEGTRTFPGWQRFIAVAAALFARAGASFRSLTGANAGLAKAHILYIVAYDLGHG